MRLRIKSPKDFWTGVMFVGFGAFAMLWAMAKYRLGTTFRIGPGYFPVLLGALLTLVGAAVVARSLRFAGLPVGAFHWRSFILIPLATLIYGYLLDPLGVVLATVALVMVSGLGGPEFRWREALALGAGLAVLTVVLFVVGLGMPFPVWPRFL